MIVFRFNIGYTGIVLGTCLLYEDGTLPELKPSAFQSETFLNWNTIGSKPTFLVLDKIGSIRSCLIMSHKS